MTAVTAPVQNPQTETKQLSPAKAAGAVIENKLKELEERIAVFCPPGITPANVRHSTMVALGGNRKLLTADPMSVVMSAIMITQWGLQIGQTAFIIPYDGIASPVAHYQGLNELIMATRLVKAVNAKEIRENDFFDFVEGQPIIHRPDWRNKNSPIIGSYCSMPTVAGGYIQDVLSLDEIEAIRSKSIKWNPSKVRDLPYWYARKTASRRGSKSAPRSWRLQLLLNTESDTGDLTDDAMNLVGSGNVDKVLEAGGEGGAPSYIGGEPPKAIGAARDGFGINDEDSVL